MRLIIRGGGLLLAAAFLRACTVVSDISSREPIRSARFIGKQYVITVPARLASARYVHDPLLIPANGSSYDADFIAAGQPVTDIVFTITRVRHETNIDLDNYAVYARITRGALAGKIIRVDPLVIQFSPPVRIDPRFAAAAEGAIPGDVSEAALLAALDDPGWSRRCWALRRLTDRAAVSAEAMRKTVAALSDPDPDVRGQAAACAAKHPTAQAAAAAADILAGRGRYPPTDLWQETTLRGVVESGRPIGESN